GGRLSVSLLRWVEVGLGHLRLPHELRRALLLATLPIQRVALGDHRLRELFLGEADALGIGVGARAPAQCVAAVDELVHAEGGLLLGGRAVLLAVRGGGVLGAGQSFALAVLTAAGDDESPDQDEGCGGRGPPRSPHLLTTWFSPMRTKTDLGGRSKSMECSPEAS